MATAYTTVRDQLNDKEGIVIGMTPEEIAEGVQKMLENEGLRNEISDYLRQRNYGNIEEMKKFYDSLE